VIYRSLDIEAVVDTIVWTPPAPSYKWEPASIPTTETVPVLVRVDPFPPPHAWRVIALSCVDVEFNPAEPVPYAFRGARSECLWAPGGSAAEQDSRERELLTMFSDSMFRTAELPAGAGVTLVTWNGRTYDLPVIMMRCLKHVVSCGWYYKSRDMRYRFSDVGHLDLMDFLGDYGAAKNMKLGDVARLVGLPGKTDTKGDQVQELYDGVARAPETSEEVRARISRYCLQDTVQTAVVLLRSLVLRGILSYQAFRNAIATFEASEVVRQAIDVEWDKVVRS
jgi:predicted PolB exonuclease-like 3'-5' exonuclease